MTWVPVDTDGLAERDALLGLKPEAYAEFRKLLERAWLITDPRLLELCRLRLAQITEARAELAGADEELLADLENWRSNGAFSEREQAALAWAEQYHYDHNLTGEQRVALASHLSRRDEVNFIGAVHQNDAYMRVLSLLDVAPDPPGSPPRPERTPPATGALPAGEAEDGPTDVESLKDAEFWNGVGALGKVVVPNSQVDDLTSEAIRLHNASHQGCRY